MRKQKQLLWILPLFLALLSGILRAEFFPKAINNYELRAAQQMPVARWQSFAEGEYQKEVESALSDQIPFSQYFKKAYNELSSAYLQAVLRPIAAASPETVLQYRGYRIFQGYILYSRADFQEQKAGYAAVIESFNRAMAENPDTDFAFYLIETDSDCDVLSGKKNPCYETLVRGLALPEEKIGRLPVEGFEDFRRNFRRTDHHWNHRGSYQGYLDVLKLLQVEDRPLAPAEERCVDEHYAGTKASTARLPRFREKADVYFFDYPELGAVYGDEESYRAGSGESFSYGLFYGGDEAELMFDTGLSGRENLLVIGDSFDNAILKLLASHFHRTFSVDLRYYRDQNQGRSLDLSAYIRDHRIDRVLVIGSNFLYSSAEFAVRS